MKTRTTNRKTKGHNRSRARVSTQSQGKARVQKHLSRHAAFKRSQKGALPLLIITSLTILIVATLAAAVTRAETPVRPAIDASVNHSDPIRTLAQERVDLSSEAPKKSTSERIREYAQSCFDRELALWESQRGRLPTDEEADFIIDACANPKLK